jgi:hypothetical protein
MSQLENFSHCTVSVIGEVVCDVGPSVAVTVIGYDPGTVVGVIVTVAVAILVESAWEVAVMVALPGRPAATVGAVYTPAEVIDPPFAGDTDQFTAVLLVFATVAINVAV